MKLSLGLSSLVLLGMLIAPPAMANHRPNPHHFEGHHERLDLHRVRVVRGRTEICFRGTWFYTEFWPGWVYSEDIYFVEIHGNWFLGSWSHPSYILVAVQVVE